MKKIFVVLLLTIGLTCNSFAAGSSSSSSDTKSNYDKAVKLIKAAKKYEIDGKVDKAKKRYERALKFLVMSNNCLLYTSPSPRDQRGSRVAGCA